jgi:tight adherence protein C
VLDGQVRLRKRSIFEDFPDALDLLTVYIEAGLSLDAGIMKVAEEVKLRSTVVASELELFLLELRSGFAREKALRNLSLRTGVEDIDSFTTMLIQAERFGTTSAIHCACYPIRCARGAGCAPRSRRRRSH